MKIVEAKPGDLPEVLELQHLAYGSEAELYEDYSIAPLVQTLEELEQDVAAGVCLLVRAEGRVIASIRARASGDRCFIGKLAVHPEYQGQGIGYSMIAAIERRYERCTTFEIFTGHRSERNLYLYGKAGYRAEEWVRINDKLDLIYLRKYPNQ